MGHRPNEPRWPRRYETTAQTKDETKTRGKVNGRTTKHCNRLGKSNHTNNRSNNHHQTTRNNYQQIRAQAQIL